MMTIFVLDSFLGFENVDSMLHSCLILLFLYFMCDIWPSLRCMRSHSDSFSDSTAGSTRFRRSIP